MTKNAPDAIKRFHDEYPERDGPPMRLAQWKKAHDDEVDLEPHPDDNKPAKTAPTRFSKRRLRQKK